MKRLIFVTMLALAMPVALFAQLLRWDEYTIVIIADYDVGTISIDIPDTLPADTVLYPHATVKNFGTNTASFDVNCEIVSEVGPGAYKSTKKVTDLSSGDSTQVTFFPDFTFKPGIYTVTVYTKLTDDKNPANDTLEKVINTTTGIAEEGADTPETFSFSAPTINRGRAEIKFSLPEATKVELLVYDVLGRLSKTLVSKKLSSGAHSINVNFNLPSGVYFYNLKTASGENIIKKFLLVE